MTNDKEICNNCGIALTIDTHILDGELLCKECYMFISNSEPKSDPVNHPPHYTNHPSGIECIEITRHMNFNVGNAIKYLWRNGLKDNEPSVKDLRKALWYINDEIKRIEDEGIRADSDSYRDSGV